MEHFVKGSTSTATECDQPPDHGQEHRHNEGSRWSRTDERCRSRCNNERKNDVRARKLRESSTMANAYANKAKPCESPWSRGVPPRRPRVDEGTMADPTGSDNENDNW
mmetsp:Transcript_18597/g.27284  ORF Transcript_18597/g.27284 Transcript_18597/m.27284 type:complete len:108 (-) Transcript_18597:225-548(-)